MKKYDKMLSFRFSQEEYEKIKAMAKKRGKNFSDYCRGRLLSESLKQYDEMLLSQQQNERLTESVRTLWTNMRRIGTNINQIAHNYNAGFATGIDADSLIRSQARLEELVREYIDTVSQKWR